MKIRNIALVTLVTASSLGLALFYVPGVHVRAASGEDELSQGVRAMTQVYSLVEQNFADPVSADRAIYEGAIPGMLHTLDPHSNFLDPNEWREMQRRQKAQYFGVGMEITVDDGKVTVNQPFPGSPRGRRRSRGRTRYDWHGYHTGGQYAPRAPCYSSLRDDPASGWRSTGHDAGDPWRNPNQLR
jgi:hypothetical protein